MDFTLNNSFRLIGTIVSPFRELKRGQFTVLEAEIEVQTAKKQPFLMTLTFYKKSKNQICDFRKDLTTKQVVVEGYIQGNKFTTQDGKKINYMYLVVRAIAVLSDGFANNEETIQCDGVVINDDDLPF